MSARQRSSPYETTVIDKDGNPHNVEFGTTRMARDGRAVESQGVVRDIAKRVKAEEALNTETR